MAFPSFCGPIFYPWALRENNALQLANQSTGYMGYKHKPLLLIISYNVNVTTYYIFILECVYLLLAHGAPVKLKNNFGWSPLAEAISYGDRQISKLL